MTKKEEYESRLEELIAPILSELNFELVDAEFVKEGADYYLRAYIDKEGGINIDDCENVSRKLSTLLDEQDFIEEAYILEVSSPGLGRQLKKDKDFIRENGKEVEVKLYKAFNGSKEYAGILKGFTQESVTVNVEGEDVVLARDNIAKISLAFDF